MAIVDALHRFSDNQALTATAKATNNLDLYAAEDPGFGEGTPVRLVFTVETELDSAADGASLVVALVDDTAEPIDGSSTVIIQSASIAEATLAAGYRLVMIVPPGAIKRYVGVYYTVSGENFTSGNVNCWLEAL